MFSTSWSASGGMCAGVYGATWFTSFECVEICSDWDVGILIFNCCNLFSVISTLSNGVTDCIRNTAFGWILTSWLELLMIEIFLDGVAPIFGSVKIDDLTWRS